MTRGTTQRSRYRSPVFILCSLTAALAGCSGEPPADLGITDGRLSPCPDTPNCVSSDATSDTHAIAPLRFSIPAERAWEVLESVMQARPRTTIVENTDRYLRAECRTLVFRFVDDIEFHLRPDESIIAVRSASRVGNSDLGVNRRRVEDIRKALQPRVLDR